MSFSLSFRVYAMAKRIGRIEQQRCLTRDIGAASDARDGVTVAHSRVSFENRSQNPLLPPDLTGLELSVCDDAGKFGLVPVPHGERS